MMPKQITEEQLEVLRQIENRNNGRRDPGS